MKKYRSKSTIEAIRYTWDDEDVFEDEIQDDIADFLNTNIEILGSYGILIDECTVLRPGEYLVRHSSDHGGTYYEVVAADRFESEYEEI